MQSELRFGNLLFTLLIRSNITGN